ncbi:MAG: lysophospholipid acyltransferase family protein [Alphaproteobacteria bacterium]
MTDENLDKFSYAAPGDARLKRLVIRFIEKTTGQPYLKWLYEDNRANPVPGESFWAAAVRRLELKIVCNEEALGQWPRQGPLVIVANHPFGVLDGTVISHLTVKVRPDFRILTNNLLNRADEIREHLIPIDFDETRAALETNLKSRAAARAHLERGGCLIIFPAGGVSTARRPWSREAVDAEWKTFAGKLIQQGRAPVVPVFFAGQNSRLFQLASHVSLTLRLSLLFKEVRDRIGSEVHLRIGDLVPHERLSHMSRAELMEHLRKLTYSLGRGMPRATARAKRRKRAPRLRPAT